MYSSKYKWSPFKALEKQNINFLNKKHNTYKISKKQKNMFTEKKNIYLKRIKSSISKKRQKKICNI